ncbi:MAG: hypothetical protein LBG83_04835 [Oscillospiraceae bacterium]|jgi:hypothetical protein|nr:hypothetical protein [Oscillospiraceae bacterium]
MKLKRTKPLSLRNAMIRSAAMIFATCIFVAALILEPSFSWLVSDDTRANNFAMGQYMLDSRFDYSFNPALPVQLTHTVTDAPIVKNEGDVPVFVRVAVMPVLRKGEMVFEAKNGAQLNFQGGGMQNPAANFWQNGGDGYWYYLKQLKPGEQTTKLYESVKMTSALASGESAPLPRLTIFLAAETIETRKWHYRTAWWDDAVLSGSLLTVDASLNALAQ